MPGSACRSAQSRSSSAARSTWPCCCQSRSNAGDLFGILMYSHRAGTTSSFHSASTKRVRRSVSMTIRVSQSRKGVVGGRARKTGVRHQFSEKGCLTPIFGVGYSRGRQPSTEETDMHRPASSAAAAALCVALAAASASTATAQTPAGPEWWPSEWGADDERGAANLVTPAKVLEAAALIREGRIYELGRE